MTSAPPDELQGTGNSLARNFGLMMGSQVTTFLITMTATVIIPRYLGAAVIGRLELAIAMWAIGHAVIAFGMDLAITKAVARDTRRIGQLWITGVAARFLIAMPVSIVLFGYAVYIDYHEQVLGLLIIFGINSIFMMCAEVAHSILMGLERMGPASAAAVVGRIVSVGGAVTLLVLGFDVYAVAAMTTLGALASLFVLSNALRRTMKEFDSDIPARVTRDGLRNLLRDSQPYFWLFFFMIAYRQVDIVVISLVVEDDSVLGWYSVYDRLASMLMFMPTVFMSVIYPTLSRLYGDIDDTERAAHGLLTQRTFRFMLLISVPSGIGLSVIARPLIELIFGSEFTNAAPVVAVGGIVISLTYLNTIFGMFLISMDKQRALMVIIALSAALTIPLDIFLVPFFQAQFDNGAIGGAVAYAITESAILAGILYLLPRGALGPTALGFTARVVTAGALMAAAVFPIRNLFLPIPIAAGAATFVIAGILLRLATPEDRELVLSVLPERFVPTSLR